MTDEDQKKIQAIADGLGAAIREVWPELIAHQPATMAAMPRFVRETLRAAVTRLRNAETRLRSASARKRAADLEAAQAARPDRAQQARDGSWWWTSAGGWTNGLDTCVHPHTGVRWRAAIGDGTRAHVIDGGTPLCGRSTGSGLVPAFDEPPCVVCQRAADREVTRG